MADKESGPKMVHCVKLGEELPAMIYQPFADALGQRIRQEVSQKAWEMWIEHSKMIVNEYRLDLTSQDAHKLLKEQCEAFFWGDKEVAPPPEYVAESSKDD